MTTTTRHHTSAHLRRRRPRHRTVVSPGWYSPDDCRLDDLRALVEVETDPARYPHADEVVSRVLVYGERWRCGGRRRPLARRTLQAELADALLDGPGIVVFRGAFDPATVDAATTAFHALIADQKAAGRGLRRPLRQARGQRPGLGRAGQAGRRRPGDLRRLLRQRRPRPGERGLARPRLPGHLAGQRRQPRRPGAGRAPRLPPRLHGPRPGAGLPRPRPRPLPRADAPGGRGPRRHARRDRADALPPALAEVPGRLPRLPRPRLHGVLRGAPRPAAAEPRRRGLLQPGPLPRRRHQPHRPTSVAWRTCCRSPAPSDARWRPSTRAPSAPRSTPCCAGGGPRASTPARSPASWRLRPRPTPSPPTSTSTSRSGRWRRRARPTCSTRRWPRTGRPTALAEALDAQQGRRRSQVG